MPLDTPASNLIPFRQLRLRPKTLLQGWRPGDGGVTQEWQFCAAIEGKGLMLAPLPGTKMPALADGSRYGVQGFTGQHDFRFETRALGSFEAPFAYVLMEWPVGVEARLVRHDLRIRTLLPAKVAPVVDGKGPVQTASILDLSASGALIEALHPTGGVGDALRIAFSVEVEGESALISTEGIICHRASMPSPSRERLGLSFRALPKNERLLLSVYLQALAESADDA